MPYSSLLECERSHERSHSFYNFQERMSITFLTSHHFQDSVGRISTKQMDKESIPLLKTKLHIPPQRSNWVLRPRLMRRLDETMFPQHRLTLISARAKRQTVLGKHRFI